MLEAYSSIKSNKLRVLLTAAIISIGIASLVGILTSIDGIKKSVSDSFSELGSNAYYIRSLRNDRGKESGVVKKNYPPIRYREISEFLKKYDGAGKATVSTTVTRIAEVKYKSEVTNPNVFVEAGDHNLVDVTQLKIEKRKQEKLLEKSQEMDSKQDIEADDMEENTIMDEDERKKEQERLSRRHKKNVARTQKRKRSKSRTTFKELDRKKFGKRRKR